MRAAYDSNPTHDPESRFGGGGGGGAGMSRGFGGGGMRPGFATEQDITPEDLFNMFFGGGGGSTLSLGCGWRLIFVGFLGGFGGGAFGGGPGKLEQRSTRNSQLMSLQSTPRALVEAVSRRSADRVFAPARKLNRHKHKPRHRRGFNSSRFCSCLHSPRSRTSRRYSALDLPPIRISAIRLPHRTRRSV